MNRQRQEALARGIAVISAVVLAGSVGFLLVDYLVSTLRAPREKALVEAMEEDVKTDAQVSVTLTAERERQTAASLSRDSVNVVFGWIVLVSAASFLAGAKWLGGFRSEPAPPMERIVSIHTVPVPPKTGELAPGRRGAAPVEAPGIDLEIVDHIVAREGRTPEAAIPILHAIQSRYGYLPDEALERVCELTEITPAQIAGTSSFYSQFRRSPVGKHIVKVCHGTACHVAGIVPIAEEMRRFLDISTDADTDPARLFTLDKVACLGCCSLAPVIMIDDSTVGKLTPASACEALRAAEPEAEG